MSTSNRARYCTQCGREAEKITVRRGQKALEKYGTKHASLCEVCIEDDKE